MSDIKSNLKTKDSENIKTIIKTKYCYSML